MKSDEKGLYQDSRDPDSFENAYSYEEIANILYGKTGNGLTLDTLQYHVVEHVTLLI